MKKVPKKVVAVAKNNAYERLYQRLETEEDKKEVFKLARARERRTRDMSKVRCFKNGKGKVLVEEEEIKGRWQSCFFELFNGELAKVS